MTFPLAFALSYLSPSLAICALLGLLASHAADCVTR